MRPFAGLSFQQLLLLAFVWIGTLLGASSLRALFTLEQLMLQSRQGAAEAIALSTTAQSLGVHSQSLERAARQSLVLADAGLRRRFEEGTGEALALLQRPAACKARWPSAGARTWPRWPPCSPAPRPSRWRTSARPRPCSWRSTRSTR
jgi:gamma-glutamylcysteine synthetase